MISEAIEFFTLHLKNKFLGGEGFFNTVVKGPGHVIVQTMPISTLAESLSGFMPQND